MAAFRCSMHANLVPLLPFVEVFGGKQLEYVIAHFIIADKQSTAACTHGIASLGTMVQSIEPVSLQAPITCQVRSPSKISAQAWHACR